MTVAKIFCFVLLIMCIVPVVCSAGGNETVVTAVFGGVFDDFVELANAIVIVLVPIAAIISYIAMVWGNYTNNSTLHDKAVNGLKSIVTGAVLVFIVLNFFDFIVVKYW